MPNTNSCRQRPAAGKPACRTSCSTTSTRDYSTTWARDHRSTSSCDYTPQYTYVYTEEGVRNLLSDYFHCIDAVCWHAAYRILQTKTTGSSPPPARIFRRPHQKAPEATIHPDPTQPCRSSSQQPQPKQKTRQDKEKYREISRKIESGMQEKEKCASTKEEEGKKKRKKKKLER